MVNILPIGDSLTWGVIASRPADPTLEQSGGYRTPLSDSLSANGFNDIDFLGSREDGPDSLVDRNHEGVRGNTIQQVSDRITNNTGGIQGNLAIADVVLLLAGTNDLIRNTNAEFNDAPNRLSNLINQIIQFGKAGIQVLVSSVPPLPGPYNSPQAQPVNVVAPRVDTFNTAIRDDVVPTLVTQGGNISFVDISSTLTPNDIFDGIHPTAEGYSEIANAWYNALVPILDPNFDPTINPNNQTNREEPVRSEFETFTLTNFVEEPAVQPGNDAADSLPTTPVISVAPSAGPGNVGTASTTFNLPTGSYDVVLGYYDDDGGVAQLQVNIGNTFQETLLLNLDGDGIPGNQPAPSSSTFVRTTISPGQLITQGTPIEITVTGDGTDLGQIDYIEFVSVNDAPVLDPTQVENLTPIEQEQVPATNNGNLVFELLGTAVTDLDNNSASGIAVTGVDNTNGTWQYSLNNGNIWTDFGTPDATTARLLAADDLSRIRFQPNPGYNGDSTITFRAWDQTRGFNGNTIDTSNSGTSTAFSQATAAPSLTVNPANNAPVAEDDSAVTSQDTAVNINVLGNDSDQDGDTLALTIAMAPSNGTAQVNDNGTPNDTSDDLISYTPTTGFAGPDNFSYILSDGTLTDTATVTVNVSAEPVPNNQPNNQPSGQSPLVLSPNGILIIQGSLQVTSILFALADNSVSSEDEVGYFIVDDEQGNIGNISPNDPNYLQTALNQPPGRRRTLFSLLNSENNPSNAEPTRQISLPTGTFIRFYRVANGSTDSVQAGQTPLTDVSLQTPTQTDAGGLNFGDVTLTFQETNTPLPTGTALQGGSQGELIDLNNQVGMLQANFQVDSEAAFDNTTGLYIVQNPQGTVLDPLTNLPINPGEAGYAEAAIRVGQNVLQAAGGDSGSLQLDGGLFYVPYLIADGTAEEFLEDNPANVGNEPLAYFPYLQANPDGLDHLRLLGDNIFAFEDVFGGGDGDYNDMILEISFV